jgi:hypothetical protein
VQPGHTMGHTLRIGEGISLEIGAGARAGFPFAVVTTGLFASLVVHPIAQGLAARACGAPAWRGRSLGVAAARRRVAAPRRGVGDGA